MTTARSSTRTGLRAVVIDGDDDGTIIYTNRAAGRIAGFDDAELEGSAVDDVFPPIADRLDPDDPDVSPEAFPRSDPRFEFEFDRPDGSTIYLGYSVSVLRDSDDKPIGHVVVFQDLTEIKRLQAEKERSQRLAAIGELAASIAHEIRNPLASISGSVEMLETVGEFEEEAADLMEIVVEEVDRLDRLISEFLEYSRPTGLSPETADLEELVGDVMEVFEKRAETQDLDVDFDVDTAVDDWSVEVDRESIRQILWNLLNNAVEALKAASETDPERPDIRVSLATNVDGGAEFIDIIVEDAGEGVDERHADRLFDPFYTTKEDGSGLGLATSHRLAQKHDGRLTLAEPGELGGARFVVRLPRDPSDLPDETGAGGLGANSSTPTLVEAEPATSSQASTETQ